MSGPSPRPPPPSIVVEAERRARRAAIWLSGTVALVMGFVMPALLLHADLDHAEATVETLVPALAAMDRIGDQFGIGRLLGSLVASGAATAAQVYGLDGHLIGRAPSNRSLSPSLLANLTVVDSRPSFLVERPLRDRMGPTGEVLTAAMPLPVAACATWVAGGLALAALIYWTFARQLAGLARRLATPLAELSTWVAQVTTVDEPSPDPPAGSFRECESIGRAIVAMLDRLAKAQHAAKAAVRYRAVAMTTQMLAHDVRRPFSMVLAGLAKLRHGGGGAGQATLLEAEVRRALSKVNGLLKDVMTFGVERPLTVAPVALEDLVAAALAEVDHRKRHVRLAYAFNHGTGLTVDGERFVRVLANLLQNAVEAVRDGGDVRITSTDLAPQMIQIAVWNSDSYIPEQVRREIFSAHYTSGKAGGTGLGLAIVDQIVREHRGTVGCESVEGDGTTFRITIPASSSPRRPASSQLPAALGAENAALAHPPPTRPSKDAAKVTFKDASFKDASFKDASVDVVIVDDDLFIREGWEATLTDIAVETFPSGEAFLASLSATPDRYRHLRCVITDYHLGSDLAMNGSALAEALRGRTNATICISSDADIGAIERPSDDIVLLEKGLMSWPDLARRLSIESTLAVLH